MSFQAMAWAIKQDIPRTSEKFLLVMLANYADRNGFCYPSIDRLASELAQDRKTVVKSIRRLIESGLLSDTGRRVGCTKSVVVYQLLGLPENANFHYLYRLENPETGEYYYGKRSTNFIPHLDDYSGSGEWCRVMREGNTFIHKKVLQVFSTAREALDAESSIFRSLRTDDGLCRNKQANFYMKRAALEREKEYLNCQDEDIWAKP